MAGRSHFEGCWKVSAVFWDLLALLAVLCLLPGWRCTPDDTGWCDTVLLSLPHWVLASLAILLCTIAYLGSFTNKIVFNHRSWLNMEQLRSRILCVLLIVEIGIWLELIRPSVLWQSEQLWYRKATLQKQFNKVYHRSQLVSEMVSRKSAKF